MKVKLLVCNCKGLCPYEDEMRVEVANPRNCVVGCTSCGQIRAAEAIRFPDTQELEATLRRLRAEPAAAPSGAEIGR